MSLQVWLPLNGDLRNQGCTGYTITAIEASPTFTAGKIGQCYQRANTSSQITNGLQIQDNLVSTFGTAASVAVWVKPLGTHTHYNGTILSSGNWNAKRWAFGVSQDNSQVDVLCGGYNNYISCPVPVNQWTHLVSTFENGVCKLYKNGVYVGEKSGQAAFDSDANWTGICRETYAGGYFGFNGCINDLRIYDHCLSAAEVKEISQGLVLHYKLDDAPILCKTNLTSWTKESGVTSTAQDDGSVKIDCTTKTSSRWGIYCDIQNVLPNTPYTFSVDCKTAHVDKKWQLSVGCNPVPSGTSQFGSNRATMNSTSGFTTYTATVTTNADTTWIRFYLALSCSSTTPEYQYAFVKNVKMTIGTSLQTTIQDSSGYGHNGTITGTITVENNSPRYSISSYFNGSSYILTPPGSFAWNDLTQLTFAAWMKPTASMTGWRGSVGIAADTSQVARGIAITDYGNEFRGTYTNGSTYVTVATGKTLIQNEWHHCAGTLNGTEFKLYFDGELVKTQTIDWGTATLNTGARFEVGVDLPGSDEKFTGNYSDIRYYCTALSADDILSLYHTSAKVDNKQNFHTFELNETNINLLSGILWCAPYHSHTPLTSPFTNYNSNGEPQFTSNGASAGTDYIEINPTGHTYEYDYTISVNAGNQFYIGFERYDANKTARSNNACVYTFASKPSSNIVKQHYTGTINLATDGTNPCQYIALRILNGWSGTTSGVTGTATIHSISLRQISTKQQPKITKTGLCIGEELKEETNTKLHKNGIIETNNLIEL